MPAQFAIASAFRGIRGLSLFKTISRFALTAAAAGFVLFAASEWISILVRDARTHYAVRATIRLQGPEPVTLQTDATGRLSHMVSTGKSGIWYGVEVSAPGYKIARSRVLPGLSPHSI